MIREELPNLIYGFCLLRLLHHVHALCQASPHTSIIISKINVKSAYRRTTLEAMVTSICITKVDDYALLILRMAFGGTNRLCDWPNIINELVTDLCNDLLEYPYWDESEIFSPHISKLEEPILLSNDLPFGLALLLDVKIPLARHDKADDFIDDIITAGYYTER